MSDGVLYRFDEIERIRSYAGQDPVLRGRNWVNPFFPHHQVINEMTLAKEGEAVYRLSFWKSLDVVLKHIRAFSFERGWVLQRISETHPSLNLFQRGDDEYFCSGDAWLYWASLSENQDNKERAPIGIHHDDIEAYTQDGEWIPLSEIIKHGKK